MAIHKKIKSADVKSWVFNNGTLAKALPIDESKSLFSKNLNLEGDLIKLSESFNKNGTFSPFQNCGIVIDRKVFTSKVSADYNGKRTTIGDIIIPEKEVDEKFFIDKKSLERWKYLKGSKNEKRFNKKRNFSYTYTEGSMIFPDSSKSPSRTIITGEGGSSPSRFKHVIKTESGKLRRLTPIELERLNMFPDNHTAGCTDIKRAFFMGNALVTGVIERIGKSLISQLD